MDRRAHWQQVYTTTAADTMSWYQPVPTMSTQLLAAAGMTEHT